MSKMTAVFDLVKLAYQGGHTADTVGAIIALEPTLLPLLEGGESAATAISGLSTTATTLTAQGAALCTLINVGVSLLSSPTLGAQAHADLVELAGGSPLATRFVKTLPVPSLPKKEGS